jgi:putative thioredoxin
METLAKEANGAWILAKIDTEQHPKTAQAYRVQGIPNVKAFINGKLVDEFSGAIPRPMIEQWLQKVLPNEKDKMLSAARAYLNDGDLVRARAIYDEVLKTDSRNLKAMVGLTEVEVAECVRGDEARFAEAERRLSEIADVEETSIPAEYARVWLAIEGYRELKAAGGLSDDEKARTVLKERLVANPKDVDTRWALGMLEGATGDFEASLMHLLEILKVNRAYKEDGARKAMVRIFRLLGDEHPLSQKWRREMGRWLY